MNYDDGDDHGRAAGGNGDDSDDDDDDVAADAVDDDDNYYSDDFDNESFKNKARNAQQLETLIHICPSFKMKSKLPTMS